MCQRTVRRFRYPGRKPLDRQACARAFVAKALCLHPTTSDLRRALLSAENLRRICGFTTSGDIPSEPTLSQAFAEFAISSLGSWVHDALVEEYLAEELVGHISRDSTAIVRARKTGEEAEGTKEASQEGASSQGGTTRAGHREAA